MRFITNIATGFVALSHIGFMILEMFFWTKPLGQKVFGITAEFAATSDTLAANQGLYNGFLAAGLIWGLIAKRRDLKIFFLLCVIVAGLFGGFTAGISIVYIQAMPALIALALLFWSSRPPKNT
jgi:putative membrane protein